MGGWRRRSKAAARRQKACTGKNQRNRNPIQKSDIAALDRRCCAHAMSGKRASMVMLLGGGMLVAAVIETAERPGRLQQRPVAGADDENTA